MDKQIEKETFELAKEIGFSPKKEKVGYSYYDEEVGCFGGKESCAIYEDVVPTQTFCVPVPLAAWKPVK